MCSNVGTRSTDFPYRGLGRPSYDLAAPTGRHRLDSNIKEHKTQCRVWIVAGRKRLRPGRGLVCFEEIGVAVAGKEQIVLLGFLLSVIGQ